MGSWEYEETVCSIRKRLRPVSFDVQLQRFLIKMVHVKNPPTKVTKFVSLKFDAPN